jgi:hypothetical protein
MAHYRGYRRSPFVPIPRRLKKAIHDWRNYCESRAKVTARGRERVKTCYICDANLDNPRAHRKSDTHVAQRLALDWSEFDRAKEEVDSQISGDNPV